MGFVPPHLVASMSREQAVAYICHVMVHRHSINHQEIEQGVADAAGNEAACKQLVASIKNARRKFAANDFQI